MDGDSPSITSGMNIPLVKYSDMPEEMRTDSVETVSTAIETSLEKHPQNYEVRSLFGRTIIYDADSLGC